VTKRVAIALLVLFGTALGLILIPGWTSREPMYQGKSLSHWFKKYYRSGDWEAAHEDWARPRATAQALRAIGTNAVPWLVAQCFTTNQNSAFETNMLTMLGKIGPFPPFVSAEDIRWAAMAAIGEIKPPASLVLPRAIDALKSTNRNQKALAICLLHNIGDGAEAAVPCLCEQLRSGDSALQWRAAHTLERLGPAAKGALPDVIGILKSTRRPKRLDNLLCQILGNLGPEVSLAVPILKERVAAETDPWKQMEFAVALWRIDARESGALGLLMEQIKDQKSSNHRWMLINKFGEIGPNAKPAVPYLQGLLNERQRLMWLPAAQALLKIGETNLAISGTLNKLSERDFDSRFDAAKLILGAQPTNATAMAALVKLMKDEFRRGIVIQAAGKMGSAAAPALPALREIANGSYPSYDRQAAREALRDIQSATLAGLPTGDPGVRGTRH
jgi:HEAT repeat protein